ncbi:MAG: LacI family DNA-binding transcriptional regulator [Anaerolineales bacterium]|nr:LacI family DNA-binding transcriptional regulator [Anaerolineales bacterium]MCB9144512.1 LacI family DNA-binding transcriptional regulator [Anaerolineales bacterium]
MLQEQALAVTLPDHKKRVTIKDVALAAGVSTQTVSRVMNKFSYVSEGTRKRVEAVVEEMGYRPSSLARSLSQQRSYTLGVITFGLKYIGPSQTLNGIADTADELGYMLLMKEIDKFNTANIENIIDSLLSQQVDGILWIAPEIGESHSWLDNSLSKVPVPMVFLAMKPRDGVTSVATDNFEGAVLATKHLLDCGRSKIGHIAGPMTWWEAEERKRGWRTTLEDAGLEAPECHCVEGNWSSASGEHAFGQLIETFPDMDGVFVGNDQMALSVLREAHRRGIQVPEQLAVIGFDNIPESAFFYPSLSTISQNLQLLGETAVETIVEMIQARQENQFIETQSRFISPSLVIRESTSPT